MAVNLFLSRARLVAWRADGQSLAYWYLQVSGEPRGVGLLGAVDGGAPSHTRWKAPCRKPYLVGPSEWVLTVKRKAGMGQGL